MAFAYTVTKKTVMGNMKVHMGGFTQGNTDTGGAIVTGLRQVYYMECTGAVTFSDSSGTVTVTTLDPGGAQTGFWMAMGY